MLLIILINIILSEMKHMIYVSCFTLFDEKFRKTSKLHLTIVFFFYLFNVSRETFCGLVFLWNLISIKQHVHKSD